jgi:hypothetical protein
MIENNTLIPSIKNRANYGNPLKAQLLDRIRQDGSLRDIPKNTEIPYQHVWAMIDKMSRPTTFVPESNPKALGYGEQFFRQHQFIQAQIRKVVDQVNIEINL